MRHEANAYDDNGRLAASIAITTTGPTATIECKDHRTGERIEFAIDAEQWRLMLAAFIPGHVPTTQRTTP